MGAQHWRCLVVLIFLHVLLTSWLTLRCTQGDAVSLVQGPRSGSDSVMAHPVPRREGLLSGASILLALPLNPVVAEAESDSEYDVESLTAEAISAFQSGDF